MQTEKGRHNFSLRVPGVTAFNIAGFLAGTGAVDPYRLSVLLPALRDETTQSASWVSLAAVRLKAAVKQSEPRP